MDLASHHWSIWADLKSGRRRSGAEISAGSVEAAGRFRDVSYCSVDLPTMETARFSKSFSTVPYHHYPRRVLTYRAFSHAWRLINQSRSSMRAWTSLFHEWMLPRSNLAALSSSPDQMTTSEPIRRQMCKLDLLRIRLMDDRAHDPSTP